MTDDHDLFEYGYRKKTLKSYAVGLIGSFILTCAAFLTVYFNAYSYTTIYILISVFALLQLLVQCVCFLRLNATSEGRWNLLPFLFVLTIVTFIVGGSYWIMYNLNLHMV